MNEVSPKAPETGGQAIEPRTQSAPDKSDDELRRGAAQTLAEHLDIGASLIARCEHLASLPKGDRLGPLYAAARLMRANAEIARALARVAQIESRRRSIIERIQTPDPKTADLNSKNVEENDNARAKLEARLDALLAASQAQDAREAKE